MLDNFVAWRLVLEALAILGMVLGLHRADDSLFYSLLLEMVRLRRGHGGTPVFHLEEQGVEPSFEPCHDFPERLTFPLPQPRDTSGVRSQWCDR